MTLALARTNRRPHASSRSASRELVGRDVPSSSPKAVKRAFFNAQGVDLQLKRREARKVVVQHTGAGGRRRRRADPDPGRRSAAGCQATLLARITVAMGVEFDEATGRS